MRIRPVFLLAILAAVFAYAGNQPALAPAILILPTPDFSKLTAYPVVRVVDGDTIVISDKGKDVKVRLVGVDTPETVHPTKPVEHYGKEASRFTQNLLKGERVYLVSDPQQRKTDPVFVDLSAWLDSGRRRGFNDEIERGR